MATFIMMIGLPGSGKSTAAKELAEITGAKIFSSDAYRAIYGSGEEDQSKNAFIFQKLREDVIDALKNNKDVILDATNISIKSRRSWLNSLPKETFKQAYLVLASYETCLRQNAQRERHVPEFVIKRMYKQFETPSLYEGFDMISTYYVENEQYTFDLFEFFRNYGHMDQENSHHTLTVGEHMHKAYNLLFSEYPNEHSELYIATLLHDIGKPFCKCFVDAKGVYSSNAHYYGHENVGAYDVLFLKHMSVDVLRVSWLINHHMDAFNWVNENAEKRYIARWGIDNYNDIKRMHEADMLAK